jgi:hypothetical protein
MTDAALTGELMAVFRESTNTANAIDALHEAGVADNQIVVMTGVPFPEGALGRHVEWLRLPYIVLAGALGGMIFGLFLSAITPHLYRLDVGGHPAVGFPPAAIIVFVFTMMATIISTFLGVLWEMDFPEFGPKYYHNLVTDGHLAVLVEYPSDMEVTVRELLETHGGDHIHHPQRQSL